FLRKGDKTDEQLIVALNFTPVPREGYHVGAPAGGVWTEVLNSDAAEWGGSGKYENGKAKAEKAPRHGRDYSLALTLPPLGCVVLLQKPAPRKTSAKAVPAAEKAAEPASPKPKTAKKKAG
ncbi:MAG TPA: alpha amylase C-terminal domain-containing protein, partial [Saprospiraceae bacterium]|nr:alpha amylase C-terminal domain-containing protein [Saprospiraceae bacterium]